MLCNLKKGVTDLKSKNFPFIPDSYLKDNHFNNNKSYKARNILSSNIYSSKVFSQEVPPPQVPSQEVPAGRPVPQIPPEQTPRLELPPGNVPATPAEPGTVPAEVPEEIGYISVGVFTASGALPVEDAVVTVYTLDENGEENVISHLVSDANGQVPVIKLPVHYDRFNPLESSEYFFSTYNLRVQAINYYTQNIHDLRVFPNITTNFQIELIPAPAGPTQTAPEMTFVIPPSPIDISND